MSQSGAFKPTFGGHNPALGKRKVPSASPGVKLEPGVKQEPGLKLEGGDAKRSKTIPSKPLTSSHGNFRDPRTAAATVRAHLRNVGTMGWEAAWFHVQGEHPGFDPEQILNILKGLDRVTFNDMNQVFTYLPDLKFNSESQLRTYLRTNSTSTTGVPLQTREMRDALPPNGLQWFQAMEEKGEILIMKSLTGSFKDLPLPKMGMKNAAQVGIDEPGTSGFSRFKSAWWDEIKERGRAAERVDQSFVTLWEDVRISEKDDVVELLKKEHLGASSAIPLPQKVIAAPASKKAKKKRGPLKITNSHMKAQGIDFSKDYEKPE